MKTCGDNCTIACDFCIYGYVIKDRHGDYYGLYCTKLKTETSEGRKCDNFHCFKAKED